MTGETAVPAKASAVVNDVLKTAWAVRTYVKTIRVSSEAEMCGGSDADCLHASVKTKMSSAPTPRTMKTARMCICGRRDRGGGGGAMAVAAGMVVVEREVEATGAEARRRQLAWRSTGWRRRSRTRRAPAAARGGS